jgi:transcription antitermination factor NusG
MRTKDEIPQWYAVTTKYKCEKLVTTALHRKGVDAYVPLLRRTRRYTRKIKNYEVPLINCYVFVRIALKDRVRVLEEPHVHQFIGFDGKIAPIPEHEMQMMRRIVGELSEVVVEPREWLEGDRVEVIAGNLTGIKGTLVEQSGKHEFVVELESLGYQLRMVVDRSVLRKVSRLESLASR